MPVEKQILTDKGIYRLVNLDGEIRLFFPKPKDSFLSKINTNRFFCYYEAISDEETLKNTEYIYRVGDHWILKWIVDNPIKLYSLIVGDNIDVDPEVLEMFMNEK